MNASWQVLELPVAESPTIEIRAERRADGGWRIRAEQSRGCAEAVSFGWLSASAPEFGIAVLHS
jgi:hypothetical protein